MPIGNQRLFFVEFGFDVILEAFDQRKRTKPNEKSRMQLENNGEILSFEVRFVESPTWFFPRAPAKVSSQKNICK